MCGDLSSVFSHVEFVSCRNANREERREDGEEYGGNDRLLTRETQHGCDARKPPSQVKQIQLTSRTSQRPRTCLARHRIGTMSSAALRSRTGRADGGGADDDASGPAPILDTDAQEALVNELEADARRQATVWRRVFGALSIAWGMYFVNSAAHAASGDVTIAWSGVRTAVASPSTSFATPIRLFATVPPAHPRPRPPSSSPPFHSPRRPRVAPNRRRYTRSFTTTIRPPCPPRR